MEPTTKDLLSYSLEELDKMPLKEYRKALIQHQYSQGGNVGYDGKGLYYLEYTNAYAYHG